MQETMPATRTMPATETTTGTIPALMMMTPTTRIRRREDATPFGDTPPNRVPRVMSPEEGGDGVGSGAGDPVSTLNPNPNLNPNSNPNPNFVNAHLSVH